MLDSFLAFHSSINLRLEPMLGSIGRITCRSSLVPWTRREHSTSCPENLKNKEYSRMHDSGRVLRVIPQRCRNVVAFAGTSVVATGKSNWRRIFEGAAPVMLPVPLLPRGEILLFAYRPRFPNWAITWSFSLLCLPLRIVSISSFLETLIRFDSNEQVLGTTSVLSDWQIRYWECDRDVFLSFLNNLYLAFGLSVSIDFVEEGLHLDVICLFRSGRDVGC